MERQFNLERWAELEPKIRDLAKPDHTTGIETTGRFSHLLFRGQGSDSWSLETTLDRVKPGFKLISEYYRIAAVAKTQIETFTSRSWQDINYSEISKSLTKYDLFFSSSIPHYDYLVYLRHHGFPSPLLDWTRSLYIAAYFAFQHPIADRIAIFVYQEYAGQGKLTSSDKPQLLVLGPNIRSDPRHFLQQGEYTLCVQYDEEEWHFGSHTKVFELNQKGQDRLWKFTLPSSEAPAMMRKLEEYNINAYTLFQSEETLLETLARQLL
jgi:FRG domain